MIEKIYGKFPIYSFTCWLLLAWTLGMIWPRSDFFMIDGLINGFIYGVISAIVILVVMLITKIKFITGLNFNNFNFTYLASNFERAIIIGLAEEFFFRIAVFGPLSRYNILLAIVICLVLEVGLRIPTSRFNYLRQFIVTLLMTLIYLKHRSIVEVLCARFLIEMCFDLENYFIKILKNGFKKRDRLVA